MSRARKFDWDEARSLRAQGWTYTTLAEWFGVSWHAVRFACDDAARQKQAAYFAEWQREGICGQCGGNCTRGINRCKACASKAQMKVRDGEAYCPACDSWKPLDAFASSAGKRRNGHQLCRPCETARKQAWRAKNPSYEATYQRARRRAAA